MVAGITWLVSLFNPAGAFIKACKAIYDVIMFFIERGSQIMALVNAVLNSVSAIASGSVGGAAAAIEGALSAALPVAISFLANLLGLGGISEKIKSIIGKVRAPVEKAVDWVIGKAVAGLKKVSDLFTGKGKGKGTDPSKDVAKGTAPGKDAAQDKGKGHPQNATGPEQGSLADKKATLKTAIAEANSLMKLPQATAQSVRERLPDIKDKFKLASIDLVHDKKGLHHIKATINPVLDGPPGVLFTAEELQELDKVAREFAQKLKELERKKPGIIASFKANPLSVLTATNVQIGDAVEAAGAPGIEQLAAQAGLTVFRNPHLQFIDASGNNIGGQVHELDFLVLGSNEVVKIVSAKMTPGMVRVSKDRNKLQHFKNMPVAPPSAIVHYVTSNQKAFGVNRKFADINNVNVVHNKGVIPLGTFQTQYLSRTIVQTIEVTELTPGPGSATGLQLRVTEPQLIRKIAEIMIKSNYV